MCHVERQSLMDVEIVSVIALIIVKSSNVLYTSLAQAASV